MKRSAAPSQRTGLVKKLSKFMTPYSPNLKIAESPVDCTSSTTTDSLELSTLETSTSHLPPASIESAANDDKTVFNKSKSEFVKKDSQENAHPYNANSSRAMKSAKFQSPVCKLKEVQVVPDQQLTVAKRYFSAVWCKRSNKKIKRWEGDAVLVVAGRSVVLYDTDGKEIGKSSGYKLQELAELKEGETLPIGSKEVEVMGIITEESFLAGKCFGGNMTSSKPVLLTTMLSKDISKKKVTGAALFLNKADVATSCAVRILKERFDPAAVNALVLSRPPKSLLPKNLEAVDVVVDPHISAHLRPHQRDGVNFLYECVMGYKGLTGLGAILADEMGLGKTLQIIALLWTLLKQNPVSHKPVVGRALIVTPGSLVKNWSREFKKWLGQERLNVFDVSSDKKAAEFKNARVFPVMIVSYEMFVRYCDVIKQSEFDILVCDEGHRLKNSSIKTASLLQSLNTRRRIVVTGTPIQNDLKEFFALVDFCNPGLLGNASSFHKVYEEPILLSKQPDCSREEKMVGEERARELNRIISSFFLRRTSDINHQYLPGKTEYVVFCKLSPLQIYKYRKLVGSWQVTSMINHTSENSPHLLCINNLKKICNYPPLIPEDRENCSASADDIYKDSTSPIYKDSAVDVSMSGKLTVVDAMLKRLHLQENQEQEKIILVSNYTKTLDVLETLCRQHGYNSLRLDGQTPVQKRQQIVELFNSSYCQHTVFLLSSKAGGVGLNLIGANRLVLYDIDWNPANDLQAMARVWREGQKKPVHIYRLLTAGTIEEKIYQRQVSKQGLGNSVVDSVKESEVKFSKDDLKDLFTFRPDAACDTHDMLMCTCLQDEVSTSSTPSPLSNSTSSHHKLKNICMSELSRWEHIRGHDIPQKTQDTLVGAAETDISFMFVSQVTEGK